MTIDRILDKYDELDYDVIVLDYDGNIEEFRSRWDMDDSLMEEEARAKLKKRELIITVRS